MRYLLPLFVFLLSCSKSTEPAAPTVNGTWSGSSTGMSATITLSQNGNNVTGSGNLSGSGGAYAVSIAGTFSNPNISLNLTSQGFQALNYTGSLNSNTLTGKFNGSGFQDFAFNFQRQ